MRNFIDIVAEIATSEPPQPAKQLDESFSFLNELDALPKNESTWHQDRRPVDLRDKEGRWHVYDNPPGNPASGMLFPNEADADAYINRRKGLGTHQHLSKHPPHDDASLAARAALAKKRRRR
jgi:hypothetical protein